MSEELTPQEMQAHYESGIRAMVYHGAHWLNKHKGNIKIQYNLPSNVAIGCGIEHAKELGLISLSPDADEFIRFMTCETPDATVIMLKCALELLREEMNL